MTNPELDDIFYHPDLLPPDDGWQDVQTLELMHDAAMVNEIFSKGVYPSVEYIKALIDALNKRWNAYIGQLTYVAGEIHVHYDGSTTVLNDDARTSGYFRGFGVEMVPSNDSLRRAICYKFSDQAPAADNDEEILFFAESSAYLEFPDIVSDRRLDALVEPLIEIVDEQVMHPDVNSTIDLLERLRTLSFDVEIGQQDAALAYGAMARYLDTVSDISEIQTLAAFVDGITYRRETGEAVDVNDAVELGDPHFFVKKSPAGKPELCLLANFKQPGSESIGEKRITPLRIISSFAVCDPQH